MAVLARERRPMRNSLTITGTPSRATHSRYTSRKAAPPLLPTSQGKRQMLPSPTAEPAEARMIPSLLPKLALSFVVISRIVNIIPYLNYIFRTETPIPLYDVSVPFFRCRLSHTPALPAGIHHFRRNVTVCPSSISRTGLFIFLSPTISRCNSNRPESTSRRASSAETWQSPQADPLLQK